MRHLLWLFVLHAFLFLPLSLQAGETAATSADPVSVQTARVTLSPIPSRVEVVGTVQAVLQATIAARVSGMIVEVPVVMGSRVRKGQLLVQLSAEEISARALQAQAQLAQARRNLEREEKLLKENASTPETVKGMRDMLAIAEAGFREAKSLLSYTTITAPFSGVITRKIVSAGDLAVPGAPLLQLEDSSRLQVVASLPESMAARIRNGDHLDVRIPAAETTLSGSVAEISPVIDPRSRTTRIKIDIKSDPGIKSGMFARVRLPVADRTSLMVPIQAVVPFGQLDKVFVVEQDRAHLRLVRTGQRTGGRIEVLSGLEEGEVVAVSNNRLLVDGQPLKTEHRP